MLLLCCVICCSCCWRFTIGFVTNCNALRNAPLETHKKILETRSVRQRSFTSSIYNVHGCGGGSNDGTKLWPHENRHQTHTHTHSRCSISFCSSSIALYLVMFELASIASQYYVFICRFYSLHTDEGLFNHDFFWLVWLVAYQRVGSI